MSPGPFHLHNGASYSTMCKRRQEMKQKEFWFALTANRFAKQLMDRGVCAITISPVPYHPFTWIVKWNEPKPVEWQRS
jgi:hypothetical protein